MQHYNRNLHNLNIDVVGQGYVHLNSSWNSDDARNYFTRLYLVTEGSGYLRSKTEDIQMLPGNIYLIPSEYDFGFGCESLEKVFFHILLPSIDKTDTLSTVGRILTLPDSGDLIESLRLLHNSTDIASLIKTKMLLYTVLDSFFTRYNLQLTENQQFSPLVEKALTYLWENISVKLSVKDIAEHLFVSESKLRNAFKNEVGTALGTYIDDAVFFTVRKMLSSDYPIGHIANTLEFCDRNYLSRRFKEKFGKTISQYRQEMKV